MEHTFLFKKKTTLLHFTLIRYVISNAAHFIAPIFMYTLVASVAIAFAIFFWTFFDTLAYKIVTLFISIIIFSNCLAKIFAFHFLNN